MHRDQKLVSSGHAPPSRDSNSESTDDTDVPGSLHLACAARFSIPFILNQLMHMSTRLNGHIDGSHTSFNERKDRLDEHIRESRANFKEIKDKLDDIHDCLLMDP